MKKREGRVQIYTGDGKGKTTAAIGLAIRALGRKMRTYIGQFMKGQVYGELLALERFPDIRIEQYGDPKCIHRSEVTPRHIQDAREGLGKARREMLSGQWDIVVLDEVNVAIWFGLLDVQDVLHFLDERPEEVELVLTGRKAPDALIERADLVTEMREIKHYYQVGVQARPGIEN